MTGHSFRGVLFIALCLLAACGAPEMLHLKKAPEAPISIVSVEGRAIKSGRAVKPGESVSVGETILVEEAGFAVIKIKDRASFQLKDAGKLIVDEVSDSVLLTLDYGSLLSVVSPTGGKKFHIVTPAATVGVRGTAFYMEARAADQTYVCLCEGAVSIEANGVTQEIRAPDRSHHVPVLIAPDKAGRMAMGRAEMLNHTNADIESLERALRAKK